MALDRTLLERLFPFEVSTIDRILTAEHDGHIETVHTEHGPVMTVDGRKLHSTRDPLRESLRWARNVETTESTVIVLFGYGSGYAARALRRRSDAAIIVFDPSIQQLAVGLTHGEVPTGLCIFTNIETFSRFLTSFLQGPDRGVMVPWRASVRTQPEVYQAATESATEAVGRVKLKHQTAMIRGQGWLRHYLTNLAHLCRGPTLPQLQGTLAGVPAIIVAAGPSLDRNIHMLRQLDDTALILTVNTSARALAKAGVVPHALVSIESADTTDGVKEMPWNLPAFLDLTAHPAMWQHSFRRIFPISVDTNGCSAFSNKIAPGLGISAGFCVANAGVAVAHALGCDPIVLIGSDLSFQGERMYAQNTIFESMRAKSTSEGMVELVGTEARRAIEAKSREALGHNAAPNIQHTIEIPSYDESGLVTSSADFKMFRDWYTYAASRMNRTLINATEGGAHIPDWDHMPLARVIERYQLNDRGDRPSVSDAVTRMCEQPGLAPAKLLHATKAELSAIDHLLTLIDQACDLVGNDPDGDLRLSDEQTEELGRINHDVRAQLRDAPLASEATFEPIEYLRLRGHITTFGLYGAMKPALLELRSTLQTLVIDLQANEPPQAAKPHLRCV